ncbi:unnamed protein product [Moneuplotes crassus]|uniref:BTB domain-containing protein n=1 Tax=Euplotes crassus TaxID=5936 RepID=A0AAD1XAR9_EUPCR|nr:unnamed protein product [Moneuplotes crassus]
MPPSIRNAHDIPNDIIFHISEDLYDSPNGRIVLLQESTKNIKFTQGRTFQSYINEFCGVVGLSSSMLKFMIDTNKRVPDPRQKVRSSCVLIVNHSNNFNKLPNKSLKPALKQLLNEGSFSDVIVHVNGEELPVHKCIMCTQSRIFSNVLATPDIKKTKSENNIGQTSEEERKLVPILDKQYSSRKRLMDFVPECIHIVSEEYDDEKIHLKIIGHEIYMIKLLLEWIYSGDIILPTTMNEVIKLSELSEIFMIDDLTNRCQEDIINHVNVDNVVEILCNNSVPNEDHSNYLLSPIILKHCKSFFLKEFQEILLHDKDVEMKICKIPGLVTSLLTHKTESKSSSKKERKVTFSLSQNEIHSTPMVVDRYNDGLSSISGSSYDRSNLTRD